MRLILALVAAVFCAVPTSRAADDEKYLSKDGKYAVKFPPDSKVKPITQKVADLDLHFILVQVDGKEFAVMYGDLPARLANTRASDLLDAGQKNIGSGSGAKVIEAKDIEFGRENYPGRDIVAEKDGNKVRARVVLVGQRLYTVLVAGPKDFAISKEATRFLDSFEITK
jgi:hypothetical protein